MKKLVVLFVSLAIICALNSCATLIGGSSYTAHVVAVDHSNATISVNGETKGVGTATFQWKRSQADNLAITLKEEGCEEQTTRFYTKSFRVMPLLGNILIVGGIPGIIIDFATQSVWKPDTNERGVSKISVDAFLYEIIYDKCPAKKEEYNMQL